MRITGQPPLKHGHHITQHDFGPDRVVKTNWTALLGWFRKGNESVPKNNILVPIQRTKMNMNAAFVHINQLDLGKMSVENRVLSIRYGSHSALDGAPVRFIDMGMFQRGFRGFGCW